MGAPGDVSPVFSPRILLPVFGSVTLSIFFPPSAFMVDEASG